jgi:hypothetical protein
LACHSTKLFCRYFTEELLQLVCKALVLCNLFQAVILWSLLLSGFFFLSLLVIILLLLSLCFNQFCWFLLVLFCYCLLSSLGTFRSYWFLGLLLGFGRFDFLWSVFLSALLRLLLPSGKPVVRADFRSFFITFSACWVLLEPQEQDL